MSLPLEIADEAGSISGDAPTEKDELRRGRYVRELANVIRTAETPLVMAVYGAWGSGKTSMMLQLRRAIEPGHDRVATTYPRDHPRTVWFDPWMHQFDEFPAVGLLHATAAQLGLEGNIAVRQALCRIAIALSEDLQVPFIGLRVGRLLKIREELAQDMFTRREERVRLRDQFRKVLSEAADPDRRIVFFIDDLDRCRPKVALDLLEALKLYLDFPGCVYVLGVDRQPLEAAVRSEYASMGLRAESYLDKIIQLPFSLPPVTADAMEAFVRSRVPPGLSSCRELLWRAAADDPRNIKRMINALLLNHRFVEKDLFVGGYKPALLAATIVLQMRVPELYQLLREDPSLVHNLFMDPSASDGLWEKHIAPVSGLSRALRLVEVTESDDLTPYLTLASKFDALTNTPRNSPCPCGSGKKYKMCHGTG